MRSGPRDQPIYFESPVTVNDGGTVKTTWQDAGGNSPPQHDWAYVTSPRGTEAFESARTNATETIRVCCAYRDDVKTSWRLKWLGQYYEITHVDRSAGRNAGELWMTARLLGAQ